MKEVFTVTHVRPDRKRSIKRRLIEDTPVVRSEAQLAGYLTHKLFTDAERGPDGSSYVIEREAPSGRSVFAVNKRNGRYIV